MSKVTLVDNLSVEDCAMSTLFWARVDVQEASNCWPWKGNLLTYGLFNWQKKLYRSNRKAWELTHGSIPNNLFVLHTCDNPGCYNPAHLFLGTHQDNMDDMYQKGRGPIGDKSGARKYPERRPRGDTHWTRRYPERVIRGEAHGLRRHPEQAARGDRNGAVRFPRKGSLNGRSKLTESDVAIIRQRLSAGASKASLSREFSVSESAIRFVAQGKTWKESLK